MIGLRAAHVLPAWPGLPHQVGLPPFDLLADLELIFAKSYSLAQALAAMGLDLSFRVMVLAASLPGDRRIARSAGFYVALLPFIGAAAASIYAGRALHYSGLFWTGLAVAALGGCVAGPLPWRQARSAGALVVAAYLALLAGVGWVISGAPAAAQTAWVVPSAVLTILAERALASVAARPGSDRPRALAARSLTPVAAALTIVLAGSTLPIARVPGVPHRRGTLLVVPGIETSSGAGGAFSVNPAAFGFSCRQTRYFSYAGMGRGTPRRESVCPITSGRPYSKVDTERSIATLAATFKHQIARLRRPVVVLADSEGAWVAWDALSGRRPARAADLVMVAPLPAGGTGYRAGGANRQGTAASVAVRLVAALGRATGFSSFTPQAPLAREMLANSSGIPRLFARRLAPRTRALAVPSLEDAAVFATPQPRFGSATVSCPVAATHAAMVTSRQATATINRYLSNRSLPGPGGPGGACPPAKRLAASLAVSLGASFGPPPVRTAPSPGTERVTRGTSAV